MKVVISGTRRFNFVAECDVYGATTLQQATNVVMDMSIYDMSEFITQMDDDREGYMSIEVVQEEGNPEHFIVIDENGDFIEEAPLED